MKTNYSKRVASVSNKLADPGTRCTRMIIICFFFLFSTVSMAQRIIIHDPVMIKQDSVFYAFGTGDGIAVWSSTDMKNWKKERAVFSSPPEWIKKELPDFKNVYWAPDISWYNGQYYLFYAASAFGKNTSCIGVATSKTLHPSAPGFGWRDLGKVIESVPGRDDWNAIDPALKFDEKGDPWLSFGSFWRGIKLVKLNRELTGVDFPQQWTTIAARPRDYYTDEKNAGEGAIEAPFIFKKNNFYYLFVSFDYCCRGLESNYKIMVGRSEKIDGPYLDKNGFKMLYGGGTTVLAGNKDWPGVGHNSAYTFDGKDYLVFHGYDAHDGGKPKLLILEMNWDKEGWPEVKLP